MKVKSPTGRVDTPNGKVTSASFYAPSTSQAAMPASGGSGPTRADSDVSCQQSYPEGQLDGRSTMNRGGGVGIIGVIVIVVVILILVGVIKL